MNTKPPTPAWDRIVARLVIDPDTGCWLFQGAKGNEYGHRKVRVKVDGKWKMEWAHRVSYIHHLGPIPNGMVVRHSCDVAACVNPAHFTLGTVIENNHDIAMRCRGANQYGPFTSFVEATDECPF